MIYLRVIATPIKEHLNQRLYSKAVVNGWVNSSRVELAVKRIRKELIHHGWILKDLEVSKEVNPDSYSDGTDAQEHCIQARTDGVVLVIYAVATRSRK